VSTSPATPTAAYHPPPEVPHREPHPTRLRGAASSGEVVVVDGRVPHQRVTSRLVAPGVPRSKSLSPPWDDVQPSGASSDRRLKETGPLMTERKPRAKNVSNAGADPNPPSMTLVARVFVGVRSVPSRVFAVRGGDKAITEADERGDLVLGVAVDIEIPGGERLRSNRRHRGLEESTALGVERGRSTQHAPPGEVVADMEA